MWQRVDSNLQSPDPLNVENKGLSQFQAYLSPLSLTFPLSRPPPPTAIILFWGGGRHAETKSHCICDLCLSWNLLHRPGCGLDLGDPPACQIMELKVWAIIICLAKNCSSFLFSETVFLCVSLSVLKLSLQSRLALNSNPPVSASWLIYF